MGKCVGRRRLAFMPVLRAVSLTDALYADSVTSTKIAFTATGISMPVVLLIRSHTDAGGNKYKNRTTAPYNTIAPAFSSDSQLLHTRRNVRLRVFPSTVDGWHVAFVSVSLSA